MQANMNKNVASQLNKLEEASTHRSEKTHASTFYDL